MVSKYLVHVVLAVSTFLFGSASHAQNGSMAIVKPLAASKQGDQFSLGDQSFTLVRDAQTNRIIGVRDVNGQINYLKNSGIYASGSVPRKSLSRKDLGNGGQARPMGPALDEEPVIPAPDPIKKDIITIGELPPVEITVEGVESVEFWSATQED